MIARCAELLFAAAALIILAVCSVLMGIMAWELAVIWWSA